MMSTTQEKTVHVLYTDDYDDKEEERIRKEIAEGTDEEFELVRDRVNDLRSIGRNDLAKREIEEFVESYTSDDVNSNWDALKAEMACFDKKREREFCGYVMLPNVGSWTGRQDGIPMWFATLNDCISKITNVRYANDLTIKDVNGKFEVEQAHHDSTNYFQIVELVEDTYEYEEEDEDGTYTETADIDADYLYRLGHPNTDGSLMDAFLREKCREVFFWKRYFNGETVPDKARRIGMSV